jgi:hypothetical protein
MADGISERYWWWLGIRRGKAEDCLDLCRLTANHHVRSFLSLRRQTGTCRSGISLSSLSLAQRDARLFER